MRPKRSPMRDCPIVRLYVPRVIEDESGRVKQVFVPRVLMCQGGYVLPETLAVIRKLAALGEV
jgi:hypothetical protein